MERTAIPAENQRPTWPSQRFACVVGAPRCGTTSLARMLRDHPAVSFSRVKEPHFFSRADLGDLDNEALREVVGGHYLTRYFPDVDPGAELIAEASPSYLYTPERLLPLLRLWPDAKFIIAVRDPLDLVPSLHQRLLYQGDETVTDLEKAWRLIGDRRSGQKIPRSCVESRQLLYDEVARLGKHVSRFLEVVGRERCHIILFDDLKADPEQVYAQLLNFLQLPPARLPKQRQHRARHGFRIGWLQRLLKRPPVARTVLAGEKFRHRVSQEPHREPSWLSRRIIAARKMLLRWNRAPAPPVRLSPALVKEIRETLHEDVTMLSRLLDRDLGHWLGGKRDEGAALEEAA
jgi:hypothetical protein